MQSAGCGVSKSRYIYTDVGIRVQGSEFGIQGPVLNVEG